MLENNSRRPAPMSLDRWLMKFKCPKCGKMTETQVVEADGAAFFQDSRTYIGDVPALGLSGRQQRPWCIVIDQAI
jgi:hypothetical protein